MRLLLDTNALIWFELDDRRMGAAARQLIATELATGGATICPISFWEVALAARRRRLVLTEPVESWRQSLLKRGYLERAVDGADTIAMAELADFHPDPADRLIVSVAVNASLTLVTSDEKILGWSGRLARVDLRR